MNFFSKSDKAVILALLKGEFNISGFKAKDLAKNLNYLSKYQISRLLKRLRVYGIIKKVAKNYKYYLTSFGKQVTITSQKVINMIFIPELAKATM